MPAWPLRMLYWYYRRPLVAYVLVFAVTAWIGLMPRVGEGAALVAVLLPWLLVLLMLLNLPLIAAAVRRFALSESARRNHALEHGTIHFLRARYGSTASVGGLALDRGFRVSGARDIEDIRRAFHALIALPTDERWRVVVARGCGSMIVVSQAVGLMLLVLTGGGFLIVRPEPTTVLVILAAQLALWPLRYRLGLWVQKRRLVSLAFDDARIRHIKKVQARPLTERAPVFFVETVIR